MTTPQEARELADQFTRAFGNTRHTDITDALRSMASQVETLFEWTKLSGKWLTTPNPAALTCWSWCAPSIARKQNISFR